MRPKSETLTGQELEIMKVIWPRGQATVREVYDDLRTRRSIAYTSVQTMMNVLETKGHLKRRPSYQGQRLCASPSAADGRQIHGAEFVNRVFDGSARPLLVHLLKEKGLTDRERRELQRLLDKEEK